MSALCRLHFIFFLLIFFLTQIRLDLNFWDEELPFTPGIIFHLCYFLSNKLLMLMSFLSIFFLDCHYCIWWYVQISHPLKFNIIKLYTILVLKNTCINHNLKKIPYVYKTLEIFVTIFWEVGVEESGGALFAIKYGIFNFWFLYCFFFVYHLEYKMWKNSWSFYIIHY